MIPYLGISLGINLINTLQHSKRKGNCILYSTTWEEVISLPDSTKRWVKDERGCSSLPLNPSANNTFELFISWCWRLWCTHYFRCIYSVSSLGDVYRRGCQILSGRVSSCLGSPALFGHYLPRSQARKVSHDDSSSSFLNILSVLVYSLFSLPLPKFRLTLTLGWHFEKRFPSFFHARGKKTILSDILLEESVVYTTSFAYTVHSFTKQTCLEWHIQRRLWEVFIFVLLFFNLLISLQILFAHSILDTRIMIWLQEFVQIILQVQTDTRREVKERIAFTM